MSKGWESKSIEDQQNAQAQNVSAMPKPPSLDMNRAEEAERKRKLQALALQRERILSERTASPHRRSALAAALIDIEEKLSELGWSLHL